MNYEEVEVVTNAWSSELPADLLGLIADKLISLSLSEYIKFGCVCVEWRSFSIQSYQRIKLPAQAPLLLIPFPPSLDHHHHHHQKKFPSLPSSSSSEEEEEGEEEDHNGAEEEVKETEAVDDVAEAEAAEDEDEEAVDDAAEAEAEAEAAEDEDEDEDEEDDHNGAEEEVKETEAVAEAAKAAEDEDEEAVDDAAEAEAAEDEDEDEDEDEEVRVRVRVRVKPENYYNPKEIWQGQDHKQRHRSGRIFYSLSEKMVYHDFPLPVPYYKNIRGSSHGWLVTVEECWGDDNGYPCLPVSLFNPFRTDNNEIQLPPMTSGNPGNLDDFNEKIYHSYFLKKAFLSANPSALSDPTTQLVVLAVYGHCRLAFCRPGDKAWTRLDLEEYRPIQDLICYQDQFYAVLQSGYVFAFVFDAAQLLPTPIVTLGFLPPKEDDNPNIGILTIRYLIESGGDLLQVRRNIDYPIPVGVCGYKTCQFLIFKLDSKTGEWLEMKTLNDNMIFIGDNNSISISASDFPGWSRPNSIYYTDDNYTTFICRPQQGPNDIGVFNLEDGSFERHYEAESKTIMPPPIWIQPML